MLLILATIAFVAFATYLSLLVLALFVLALYSLYFYTSWGFNADIDDDEIHGGDSLVPSLALHAVVYPCLVYPNDIGVELKFPPGSHRD
jgi:hypothetical protein